MSEPQWSVASGQLPVGCQSAASGSQGQVLLATDHWPLATVFLQIVVAVRRRGQHLVRSRTGRGVSVLVDLHAQAQTHRVEDLLDLVQRLPSKIFRLSIPASVFCTSSPVDLMLAFFRQL